MKPVAFEYSRPASIEEACALLAADADARVLAGGQTLIPMLAMRLARPSRLIDVTRIPGLSGIRETDGAIVIGAATRQVEVERSALVRERLPLLAKAVPWVGHAPTRNRGTVGGSIAHADPSAEIPLVALTLGAELIVASEAGEEVLTLDDFFIGPTITTLPPEAMIVAVRFPVSDGEHAGTGFHEISARRSDFAIVAAAAHVCLDADGRCTAVRGGIGGAGERPVRLDGLEGLLGAVPGDADIEAAVADAVGDLETMADLHATAEYRKRVARVLAFRAIRDARDEACARRAACA